MYCQNPNCPAHKSYLKTTRGPFAPGQRKPSYISLEVDPEDGWYHCEICGWTNNPRAPRTWEEPTAKAKQPIAPVAGGK